MIRAVLNCLSCGSENRHNRRVFNFVHVGLFPALIQFVRLCRSKLTSVRFPIMIRVALAFSFMQPVFSNNCFFASFPMTFDCF